MNKDLISIRDLSVEDIKMLFNLTGKVKKNSTKFYGFLRAKTLALIFQKPSNRTRVSFEVGINQLGGNSMYLGPEHIDLGKREAVKDVAKVLSRYLDGIIARTFSHQDIVDLARYSNIPVINGLSDLSHPCQALSDIYTVTEYKKSLKGIKFAYIGDGNNVLHSLLYCCSKLGVNLDIATPRNYEPDKQILNESMEFAKENGCRINLSNDPINAVKGSDVVYTDVWTSMGQEGSHDERLIAFSGFQINSTLLKNAKSDFIFMHCLPAHRGEEVTDEVLDGPHSIVYDQAENRLHLQKSILITLLKK